MGRIEENARKRKRRNDIQGAVLAAVGTAGIISLALLAPNIFQALPHVMGKERYKLAFKAKGALDRLVIKGLVKRNSHGHIEITEKGRRHLSIEEAERSAPARAKRRWDGQFRLVMFDIPQRRRRVRDRLRELMRAFGFLRLQDSVWVTPYDCEDLLALVKAELHIGRDVLYAVVREIENDAFIRDHFDLH